MTSSLRTTITQVCNHVILIRLHSLSCKIGALRFQPLVPRDSTGTKSDKTIQREHNVHNIQREGTISCFSWRLRQQMALYVGTLETIESIDPKPRNRSICLLLHMPVVAVHGAPAENKRLTTGITINCF